MAPTRWIRHEHVRFVLPVHGRARAASRSRSRATDCIGDRIDLSQSEYLPLPDGWAIADGSLPLHRTAIVRIHPYSHRNRLRLIHRSNSQSLSIDCLSMGNKLLGSCEWRCVNTVAQDLQQQGRIAAAGIAIQAQLMRPTHSHLQQREYAMAASVLGPRCRQTHSRHYGAATASTDLRWMMLNPNFQTPPPDSFTSWQVMHGAPYTIQNSMLSIQVPRQSEENAALNPAIVKQSIAISAFEQRQQCIQQGTRPLPLG